MSNSTETTERDFSSLSFEEKVAVVDQRIGNQPDRIKHPHQLLDLTGKTIYLVMSPFGKDENIGTCFKLTWDVGEVKDHRGNLVEKDKELTFDNNERYLCHSYANSDNGLSMKDFNIIPNGYNNNAAFVTEESADAYIMYRKMMFPEDSSLQELEGDFAAYVTAEDIERLVKSEDQEKAAG